MKMNDSNYYFEYKYSLFEIKEELSYLMAFIPINTIDNNIIEKKFIKKFRFKSFDSKTHEEINSLKYNDFLTSTIINVFFMDDSETLVVFIFINVEIDDDENTAQQGLHSGRALNIILYRRGYLKTGSKIGENVSSRRKLENNQLYKLKLYDKNLNFLKFLDTTEFNFQIDQLLYFKSIYI